MITEPPKLDHKLPATPVTREIRQTVEKIAKEEGVPMVVIMRRALAIFLAGNVQNMHNIDHKLHSEDK